MTELPPKKVLESKLRIAIESARDRLATKENGKGRTKSEARDD